MTTRNEAAERPTKSVRMSAELVDFLSTDGWDFGDPGPDGFYSPTVRITPRHVAALAAERRATVERIRTTAATAVDEHYPSPVLNDPWLPVTVINAILDEEAAR